MPFGYAGVHAPILKSTECFSERMHNVSFRRAFIPVASMHSLGHCDRDIVSDGFVQMCVSDAAEGFDGAVLVDDRTFPKHMICTGDIFSTMIAFPI